MSVLAGTIPTHLMLLAPPVILHMQIVKPVQSQPVFFVSATITFSMETVWQPAPQDTTLLPRSANFVCSLVSLVLTHRLVSPVSGHTPS